MTTQVIVGQLLTNRGAIPLETSVTDGADNQEVKTDATFTVTSQSIGTFADGQQLLAGFLSAKTNVLYAYILRNGTNVCNIRSMYSRTGMNSQKGLCAVSNPMVLRPGDQLVVRTEA